MNRYATAGAVGGLVGFWLGTASAYLAWRAIEQANASAEDRLDAALGEPAVQVRPRLRLAP